jgi:hypothetical protein
MTFLGACSKTVEAVPRIWAMDVVDGLSKDITGTMAHRMLLCPCGIQRRFLYVFQGKLGCQTCLRLLYWEQTAISKARWRQEVARPAIKAHRRALAAVSKGSDWPRAENAR